MIFHRSPTYSTIPLEYNALISPQTRPTQQLKKYYVAAKSMPAKIFNMNVLTTNIIIQHSVGPGIEPRSCNFQSAKISSIQGKPMNSSARYSIRCDAAPKRTICFFVYNFVNMKMKHL